MGKVNCPTCGKPVNWKGDVAGKRVKCPHCGQVWTVPAAADAGVRGFEDLGLQQADRDKLRGRAEMLRGRAEMEQGRAPERRNLASRLASRRTPRRMGSRGPGTASVTWHRVIASVLNVFGAVSWVGGLLWIVLVLRGAFKSANVSTETAYFAVVGIAAWAGLSGAILFGFASVITLLVDLRTLGETEARE